MTAEIPTLMIAFIQAEEEARRLANATGAAAAEILETEDDDGRVWMAASDGDSDTDIDALSSTTDSMGGGSQSRSSVRQSFSR